MNRTSPLARRTAWLGAALFAALFLLLTGLITARHGAPYTLDQDVHQWAVDHRRPAVATLFRIVTSTGTGPFPYLCAAGAGWIAGHDARSRLLAAAGALGFLVTAQAVRYSVMHATARPRPPGTDWATHATGFAFPSGHTTTSALAAGLLACALSRKIGPAVHRSASALLAGWAVTVGLSRIYLGVHWPTDVLGGWLYALTWLTAATALTRSKHRRPLAAPRRHHSAVTAQHPRQTAVPPGTHHLRMSAEPHRPLTPPDGR
ncbi:phosphatase PAP2 family protein [Streptomyces sp. NBC_01233]|uniref:phosphatase PAP2 family protein n=1 Tax=Streptomyces sp. NBC_01233 TaxID=2903787 RepID=UPI002E1310A4|nr:phosphatase PAP2 family protein [Streptomyces sp. NBC_01233]